MAGAAACTTAGVPGARSGRAARSTAATATARSRVGVVVGRKMPTSPGSRKEEAVFTGIGAFEAMVLAIKTMDGGVLFPPRADHCLRDADRIVIMGKADALARLIAAAS